MHRHHHCLPAALVAAWGVSCTAETADPDKTPDVADDDSGAPAPIDPGPSPYPLDDTLRLADVQALGTHNSYHIAPETVVFPEHAYTHAPLGEQLADQGVRQFELDLHHHSELGFQIFHLPNVDDRTVCLQFTDCLQEMLDWSDAHPWHLPVMVWLEPKYTELDLTVAELGPIVDRWDEVEDTVRSVLPAERIYTPDELRGDAPDLPSAVRATGGPTLGALRGRFIFSILDTGDNRDAYLAESSVLAGRLFFVDADSPDDPWAAFFKINDARSESERVAGLVAEGFVVTSNVDGADNTDAECADKLAASLASGTSFLSTDFPAPVADRAYSAEIPDGVPARCSPARGHTAETCSPTDIEVNGGAPNIARR